MKHKTWFRLVLKAIGILLIALALPDLIYHLAGILRTYRLQGTWSGWPQLSMTETILWVCVSPVIQIGIGAYLLSGASLLADWIIPSNRPYCPDCGYDLSQSTSTTCAECGADVRGIINPPTASDA